MSRHFPKVTLSGDSASIQLFQAPATALGVEIDGCLDGKPPFQISPAVNLSVTVARSPHNQAVAWATTSLHRESGVIATVTPAITISAELSESAQKLALEIAQEISLVGVATVVFKAHDEELTEITIIQGVHPLGNWSIDGSVTSQYEQHLRAILDLPLGSPALKSSCVVSSPFYYGEKENMYRPYLHLMARTSSLKFHQYRNEYSKGRVAGHLTIAGENPNVLLAEIAHARDYMNGAIDE